MGGDGNPDILLPSAKPMPLAANVALQRPLSRLGKGPGLLILVPSEYEGRKRGSKHTLDPEPLQKWAEEGFTVAEIKICDSNSEPPDGSEGALSVHAAIEHSLKTLQTLPECTFQGQIGVIGWLATLLLVTNRRGE
jgi:carboxymethylenebutenolidase